MADLEELSLDSDQCLVVEDDPTLRMLIRRCARAHGFDVAGYEKAEPIWDVKDWSRHPVVLLDWQLPGAEGLELCRHIRSQPGGEVPVIILITARDRLEDVDEALEAGADDYVTKPFSVDQLRVRLRIADRQAKERREHTSTFRALEQSEARRLEMLEEIPHAVSSRMLSLASVAGGVVHDINNPLAYVLSSLEQLGEELGARGLGDDAALGEALHEALEGAERVERIVRDLGTFARGQDEHGAAVVDLHAVLDACANMAWNEIRHRATLTKDYAEVPLVAGRASALSQVFLNLILNSVHALPEGRASEHRLELKTYTNARGEAVVEVVDDGCGMGEEELAQAFDPLFTTRGHSGATGLGLPIAASFVQEMGGEIEMDSGPGEGTRARVRLPQGDFSRAEGELFVVRPPLREGPRARVLVVDDEGSVARALKRIIGTGHDAEIAGDGHEAMARIRTNEYDVIFCDLLMPDVTGMDLYEAVRNVRPGAEAHMVFMTGGAFTQRARAFLAAVPNLRIDKPFDRELVHQILDDCLRPPSGEALTG